MTTDFLLERFEERPDEPAVIGPRARCDFGELAERCRYWHAELERWGVAPGSVVALEADFSPNAIALFLALADREAILAPRCRDSGTDREAREELAGVELRIRVDTVDAVRVDPVERESRAAAHPLYEQLRRRGHAGLIQFTSGTSGEPKAAVQDLVLLLRKFEARRPALSTLAFLLFDHMGGINTALHALSNGATLVVPASRSPAEACRLIERHRVELLPVTPSFLNLMLLSGAHRHRDMSSLRVISYGAEPMPAATLDRVRAAFPDVKLQQTYGMVELGVLRTKSRDDGSLWLKVGGDGVETRVVGGVLQVHSRSQLLGYLNAPTPLTDDGWLITGDRVEQDGEYLRFLGRDSDLINVGGEKVYPAEVEGVIESMEGIAEARVYGEVNGLLGQIVCAQVAAPGEPDDSLTRRLKQFCRKRLEPYKVPVRVEVVAGERLGEGVKKSRAPGAVAR